MALFYFMGKGELATVLFTKADVLFGFLMCPVFRSEISELILAAPGSYSNPK